MTSKLKICSILSLKASGTVPTNRHLHWVMTQISTRIWLVLMVAAVVRMRMLRWPAHNLLVSLFPSLLPITVLLLTLPVLLLPLHLLVLPLPLLLLPLSLLLLPLALLLHTLVFTEAGGSAKANLPTRKTIPVLPRKSAEDFLGDQDEEMQHQAMTSPPSQLLGEVLTALLHTYAPPRRNSGRNREYGRGCPHSCSTGKQRIVNGKSLNSVSLGMKQVEIRNVGDWFSWGLQGYTIAAIHQGPLAITELEARITAMHQSVPVAPSTTQIIGLAFIRVALEKRFFDTQVEWIKAFKIKRGHSIHPFKWIYLCDEAIDMKGTTIQGGCMSLHSHNNLQEMEALCHQIFKNNFEKRLDGTLAQGRASASPNQQAVVYLLAFIRRQSDAGEYVGVWSSWQTTFPARVKWLRSIDNTAPSSDVLHTGREADQGINMTHTEQ